MGSYKPEYNLDEILLKLTLEEKISLIAGENLWQTAAINRLGVPSVKVTDGPNGARGAQFSGNITAACFPASVSLAATWNRDTAKQIGSALAEEAASKGASCLLGPTINPHRSPLGGRNFESFSEDPLLAGKLAAAYIAGVQDKGIAATVKHFAGNEQETQRYKINVNASERTLREIYLKPFEIAVREANPWAVMTSYNLLNGQHADCNKHLIQTVLRDQWSYKGLVMSDWGGTNGCAESLNAGLDLEMPGPAQHRTIEKVKESLEKGFIDTKTIDRSALAVLQFAERVGKFAHPETSDEKAVNDPAHQKLIRDAGGEGIVLLKNSNNVLPLRKDKLKKVAVLGLAKECFAHGGGSAAVSAHYKTTVFESLERFLGEDVQLCYAQGLGAHIFRKLPPWTADMVDAEGKPGFTLARFSDIQLNSAPTATLNFPTTTYFSVEDRSPAVTLTGVYTAPQSGMHYVTLSGMSHSKLYVNNELIIEIGKHGEGARMDALIGSPSETKRRLDFSKGEKYEIKIESFAIGTEGWTSDLAVLNGMIGFTLGFMLQQDYEADLVAPAVEAARGSDVAIIVTGNTAEWETEGYDRSSMDLPASGSQDRLIEAVSAVNPNVVVVNCTGSPITMPWISSVAGILQAWFPGQEAGNAIVDVLFGKVNPSGKLPVSFPRSLEDTPCYHDFPGDLRTLQVHYNEGVEVGYRHYDKHPGKVLFPFGFGQSYTEFVISDISLDNADLARDTTITVQVNVTNSGGVAGKEVVQVYIAPPPSATVDRPLKTLAAFSKVEVDPGKTVQATAVISFESAAFWDEEQSLWRVDGGDYELLVGNSSTNIVARASVTVKESFTYAP